MNSRHPICLLFSTLFIGSLCLNVHGCTTRPKTGSPVHYTPSAKEAPRSAATAIEDALILARVKTRLYSDELVSAKGVDITVRNGVVFLDGSTRDHYQGRMITNLIRSVDGVAGVHNNLKPVYTGTTFVTENQFVAGKIKTGLMGEELLTGMQLSVETTASQVVLSGSVDTQVKKEKAAAIAKDNAGSRQVINHIKVLP